VLESPEIVASILSSEGTQYGYEPWVPHQEPRLGPYLTPVFKTEKFHHPSSKHLPNRDLQRIIEPHFPDIDFTKEFVGITEPTPESVYRDVNKFSVRYWEDRVPKEVFDITVDHVVELLTPYLTPHATEFSEDGTPLFGSISTEEAMTHLNPDGVNGYPLDKILPDKRAAVVAHNQGKIDLDKMTNDIFAGHPVCFEAGGKVEVRDISKIHLDKLRSFMIAPVQLVLAGIRCTHKFQQAINAGGASSIITAGMSGCHGQWQVFLDANDSPLRPCVADSDCPAWDGGLMLLVMCAMYRIVTRFLTPEAAVQFLQCWLADVCSPVLMPDGTIAFRWGGNPSGSFLTTIGNSICNLVIFNICTMENRRHAFGETWDKYLTRREIHRFPEEIRYTVHGDDNILSASERMYIYCNHRALNQACVRLNLATRFDNYPGIRKSIHDAVYCSHSTVVVRGYRLPALVSVEKILGSLVLGSAKSIPPDQTRAYYELCRAWGFLLTIFPAQHTWHRLYRCVWELSALYQSRWPRDKSIPKALSNLKGYDAALRHWSLPLFRQSRLPQRLASVSVAEMSKQNIRRVARQAAPKLKRDIKHDVAKALNSSTHRGFRNKGKVAAGMSSMDRRPRAMNQTAKRELNALRSKITKKETPVPYAVSMSMDRAKSTANATASTGMCEAMISDVTSPTSSGTFSKILELVINPSNSTVFPKAAPMALTYEQYKVDYLQVIFVPSTGTSTAGSIAAYYDVDPGDVADTTIASVMENADAHVSNSYVPFRLAIPSSCRKWKYTNASTVLSDAAIDRQQVAAVFRMYVDRMAAGVPLGYVVLKYKFTFRNSKPPPLLATYTRLGNGNTSPITNWAASTPIQLPAYHSSVSSHMMIGANFCDLPLASDDTTVSYPRGAITLNATANDSVFVSSACGFGFDATTLGGTNPGCRVIYRLMRLRPGSSPTSVLSAQNDYNITGNYPGQLLVITGSFTGVLTGDKYYFDIIWQNLNVSSGLPTLSFTVADPAACRFYPNAVPTSYGTGDSKGDTLDQSPVNHCFDLSTQSQEAVDYVASLDPCIICISSFEPTSLTKPLSEDELSRLRELLRGRDSPRSFLAIEQKEDTPSLRSISIRPPVMRSKN